MAAFLTPLLIAGSIGASAWGAANSMDAASKQAQASRNIYGLEQQAEEQRRKAMELDAQRKRLELLRNQQRARAMALTNANNQGAQFGSGLQGGYGQISGQTETNLLGLSQNLDLGRNLFGINSAISQQRMLMADAGSQAAFGQGMTSLGGSVLSSMNAFSRLSGGLGNPFSGGQGYSPSYNTNSGPQAFYGNSRGIY